MIRVARFALASIAVLAAAARGAESVDVREALQTALEADWVSRDAAFSQTPAAAASTEIHVTTAEDASGGCDGIKNGRWGFHTASAEKDPWWQVDLGKPCVLDRIVVFNRTDRDTAPRTRNLQVVVAVEPGQAFQPIYQHNGEPFFGIRENKPLVVDLKGRTITARIVRLQISGTCSFALDEVEVYGADDPATNIALNKPADQKSVGRYSYPGTLPDGVDSAVPSASNSPSFSLAHTRQVLKQARELADRLSRQAAPQQLPPLLEQLSRLDQRAAAADAPLETRRPLYLEACRLARSIAFTNPLLNFDKLMFIKRHDAAGVFHMCDQFYGCNAVPGGGLFILSDPFGPQPRLTGVLDGAAVANGRLQGKTLSGGSFLSPDLSFDGRTVLFAYSEAKAWEKFRGKEAYEWTPECVYHIFRCSVDGSSLTQLTDGAFDDFDPCFLPNGRIAFVSQRRGGYLRCGRHCPVYAIHTMQADGSDMIPISFHETHEWQPSVTNDGMLVYTRWDYVDRDTNIAHHIWTSYPDGRDPRSFHGNYPERRESRPWMEMSIRAIPNSQKFVAVTGAHHGHAFGSLVMIDPHAEDDNSMSQLTRLTPEVPFPEAEATPIANYMIYGTPWPLSEDDYLCAYDPGAKNHGIYWIDRFGNRELIYRDPQIASIDPIPVRPRQLPPVIPDQTVQTLAARESSPVADPPATVSLLNVYDSDFKWPEATRITALRIIQVLPKTTPPPNEPRIGIANQTNARSVLGTVPVEEDGSANFEVPAGKEIYIQALDASGLAVQSMRSGTYLHPGEKLTCQGCHERKHRSPLSFASTPLALRRAPSKIQPEAEGSNPFNYVRLVQPVLDRHCVECHQQKKAIELAGTLGAANGWTISYANLAEKYGFYFDVGNGTIKGGVHGGSRSIAGSFGAKSSKLMDYLSEKHYDVRLSPEERRRITLWLDCNSEFFGSYENTAAQARGEIVRPTLD